MERFCALIALSLLGCTNHYYRAPTAAELDRPVSVHLRNGDRYREGRGLEIETDERGRAKTVVVPYAPADHRIIGADEVDHIERRRRGPGLAWGAVAGAAAGSLAALAVVYGDDENRPPDDLEPATVALAGLGIGAFLGAIIGYELGVRDVYHLRPPARPRVIAAPTEDGARLAIGASF